MATRNLSQIVLTTLVLTKLVFLPLVATAELEENRPNQLTEKQEIVSEEPVVAPVIPTPAPLPFLVEKLSSDIPLGDFVVGPGRVELEIRPGESKTVEIFVSNRISDGRIFELTTEDISGSRDGHEAVILLGAERGPHTIKDYISFPVTSFPLDLGERARIPVTVAIPHNAEPGGYYGSVLISTTDPEAVATEAVAQSPIIARIGTLFFVQVPGETIRAGALQALSLIPPKWWHEAGPMRFNLLFENTGSVHLSPYGELRIKNLFGEEVGYVELEPWFALPQSLRSREVVWDREFLFGRYTATAYVNRGYDDIVDEASVVFYVLPWRIVAGVFLVVFIIVFGFRFFFRTFEFKRRGN